MALVERKNDLEYKVHILDRHNYIIWKKHMQNVLEARGLLEVVTSEQVGADDRSKDSKTRALLTSALSSENQMKVISCNTARSIWTRLESIYENKTSTEKGYLNNKLHSYRIMSTADISKSIGEMEIIAEKLKLLGEPVSDETLIQAMMRALPRTEVTRQFISSWKSTAEAERTLSNFIARLMGDIEEDRV